MNFPHSPVMLRPAIKGLNIVHGGTYVDCTFGRGGHSENILKSLGNDGKFLQNCSNEIKLLCYVEQKTEIKKRKKRKFRISVFYFRSSTTEIE